MTNQTKPRGTRKSEIGTVVSDKMDKTITVVVQRTVRHPTYDKFLRRNTRLHAHDEENQAKLGDKVEIVQTRPMSKLKRWRLVRVVQSAGQKP